MSKVENKKPQDKEEIAWQKALILEKEMEEVLKRIEILEEVKGKLISK